MPDIRSEMSGTVLELKVSEGDAVEEGQEVALLEAMKMEMAVEAGSAGTVTEILVEPDDYVEEDEAIMTVEED